MGVIGVDGGDIDGNVRLRSSTTRGRQVSRVKREANIGWTTTTVRSRREKIGSLRADGMTVMSEVSKRSKFSADDVKGAGDLSVKSAFERTGEVLAVIEVKTEVIERFRAVRAEGSTEGGRKRRQEQMVLEERGDSLVVEARRLGGPRQAGEGNGGVWLGDGGAELTK